MVAVVCGFSLSILIFLMSMVFFTFPVTIMSFGVSGYFCRPEIQELTADKTVIYNEKDSHEMSSPVVILSNKNTLKYCIVYCCLNPSGYELTRCTSKCLSWTFPFLKFGHTIFTLNIGTPYLLTIFVLKFEIVHSATCFDVSRILLYVWQTIYTLIRCCIL